MSQGAGGEWLLIQMDEKMAKRQGIPAQIPVPKGEFEGLADKGIQMDSLKKWISAFLMAAPTSWRTQNGALAKRYDAYLGKVDMWNKAQEAFKKRDYKAAISTLKMVTNIDPDDHAAKMNLGSALAAQSDLAGALKLFTSVRETFEGEADFHVAMGHIYMGLEKKDDAVGEMVLALEAKPDHKEAMDALRALGVLVSIYENPKDAASLTYVRADSVVDYLKTFWDGEARDAKFYLEQAAYHHAERRYDVALEAAQRAAKIASGADVARAVIAETSALRSLGRHDEAIGAAEAFLAQEKNADVYVELSRALWGKGDKAKSMAAVDGALALEPGNLMAIDVKYWPEDRSNIELVLAIVPALKDYAEKNPTAAGAHRALARAKLIIGATDEAFELFQKAVALAPNDDDLRAEWWQEFAKLRKYEEIIADASKLGDMKARDWKLRWNEAEAYLSTGKLMEARAAFSAITLDESLHVDVRKRAKRAATQIGGAPGAGAGGAP